MKPKRAAALVAAIAIVATMMLTLAPSPASAGASTGTGCAVRYGYSSSVYAKAYENNVTSCNVQVKLKRYINGIGYWRYSNWGTLSADIYWADGRPAGGCNAKARVKHKHNGQWYYSGWTCI